MISAGLWWWENWNPAGQEDEDWSWSRSQPIRDNMPGFVLLQIGCNEGTFDNCWWQMDSTAIITQQASLNLSEKTFTMDDAFLAVHKNCGNFADYWINLMTTCHSFINLSSWILPNCFYWQGQVWFLIDCFLILAVIGNRLGVWFDSFDLFDLFLI